MGLLGPGAVAPKVIPGSPSSPVKSPGGDGGDERSVGSRFGPCFFFKACHLASNLSLLGLTPVFKENRSHA